MHLTKAAKAFLQEQRHETTLGQFIREAKVPDAVVQYYLIPMAASVWSADPRQMWDFPANFLLRFWANHGFLESTHDLNGMLSAVAPVPIFPNLRKSIVMPYTSTHP